MIRTILICISSLILCLGCSNNSQAPATPESGVAAKPMVIYEVNPRLFTKGQAFQEISSRLDEIKSLGVDVIWIMPSYEPGKVKSVNSPYCIKDYKKVNPDYGQISDLKALVSAAHAKDMKIILDWVANHTSWDNAWINDKSWYTQDAGGNIVQPGGTNWADVADLNFDNASMRTAMIEAMTFWINECDVDGYRCDYAEGVPLDFWEAAIKAVKSVKKDAILLAEGNKAELTTAGFEIVYAWNFGSVVKKVFNGQTNVSELLTQYEKENQGLGNGARRMRYITNHDEASGISPVAEFKSKDAALAGFVVTSLMTDVPMIYSSQEIGYASSLNFFDFIKIDWNSDPAYTQAYKDYMRVYKTSSALRVAKPVLYSTGDCISIWYATSDKKGLLAMINSSDKPLSVKVPMERMGDKVKNLLSGEERMLSGMIDLGPYEYLLFEKL